MRISIVIPVFGVELYIERCIQSLITQTCKNFEVIIVNDATKDNSIQIAKQILSTSDFPVVYFEHTKNKGLSEARNSGVKVASGEYILFLDSDDTLIPEAIELFINAIEQTKSDCIIGNYQVISTTNNYISSRYTEKKILKTFAEIRDYYCNSRIPIMAWNKCVKRELFLQYNLWFKPGIINEDELWTFILLNEITTLYLLGECTYIYYQRDNSIMTSNSFDRRIQSLTIIFKEMVSYVHEKRKNDYKLNNYLNIFVFWRYRDIFNSALLSKSEKEYYYNIFRITQKKLRGDGKIGFILRLHLHFPKIIGYHIMKHIILLYSKLK